MFSRILIAAAIAALSITSVSAAEPQPGKVTVVFDHVLPNVPGKTMKGVVVEYAPGGASPAHFHPKSAFIYATVLEGAIRSKVGDAPEKVYKAGENFVEQPGDFHAVSANASATEPARLMAVFVLDSSETDLVKPVKP
ncbi:cupin domain-containing protein [Pseudomonas sp. B2M1-30]|uniref:Cupin domain-containing protein n=1 Tax=Pseudomonas koreensis TaxID=198620 RepID=A0A9X2XJG1_9PSED|nr:MULTISPECIES: cupin domain-containing protein [Pseudomonas]MBV4476836.1 cupin domain-containing protein [Pseudomonas botevensis]MCU0121678.1 cupin domain-containing protein [Pseudomonas sp. B2M1-30]MCU7249921.1 cupin domain-containing protein [Pseudomonas koreensis]MCU7263786.1 cupin domain-containing protein [Pseudomonas koreensis]